MKDKRIDQGDIKKALERFLAIVEFLDCECDEDNGVKCTIHADRKLAKKALELYQAPLHGIDQGKIDRASEMIQVLKQKLKKDLCEKWSTLLITATEKYETLEKNLLKKLKEKEEEARNADEHRDNLEFLIEKRDIEIKSLQAKLDEAKKELNRHWRYRKYVEATKENDELKQKLDQYVQAHKRVESVLERYEKGQKEKK